MGEGALEAKETHTHTPAGTLYCAKTHFEFGVSRVIKSFHPIEKKLNTDTWFYAKRCFLAVIEHLSKHQDMAPKAPNTPRLVRARGCCSAYSLRTLTLRCTARPL